VLVPPTSIYSTVNPILRIYITVYSDKQIFSVLHLEQNQCTSVAPDQDIYSIYFIYTDFMYYTEQSILTFKIFTSYTSIYISVSDPDP
jgi:hypothetical protein